MIEMVIGERPMSLGGGIDVGRLLPSVKPRMVGPFMLFDHIGPIAMPAGLGRKADVRPHIGLSTITYLFSGEIMHRDSLGWEQAIRP